MEESEIGKELFAQEELVPIVPGFLKKDHAAALTGALTAERRTTACWNVSITAERTASQELMAQTEELDCRRKDDERSSGMHLFQI